MLKLGAALAAASAILAVAAIGFIGRPATTATAVPGELDARGRVVIAPGQVEIARAEGDRLAVELFEDGRLSFDEYDRVVRAFVACVEAQGGMLARPLDVGARPVYRVEFMFPPRGDADARLAAAASQDIVDGCAAPTYARVSAIWSLAHQPAAAELAAARAGLVACMRTAGFAVPESLAGEGDLLSIGRSDMTAFMACSDAVTEAFGLPVNFAG
ncbi:MAG: hypothetical protein KatS3mg064_1125 [Tepidiforma sp.]|jgi:hypothetical protein|nr:hypothetical protein [Tepidiforma sp.]GIW17968.1 MAG: hypothetical protein KatS3mg064_1125 [Tepidiforma sp.]